MLNQESLTESTQIRNGVASKLKPHAEEALNRAKAIIFAVWKGEGIATTEQIANYYEVSVDTVKKQYQRNADEFSLEMKKLTGKELEEVRDNKSLSLSAGFCAPHLLAWTPSAALRLGMLLTKSEVAKSLRNVIISLIENVNTLQPTSETKLDIVYKHLENYEIKSRNLGESCKEIFRNALIAVVKEDTGIDLDVAVEPQINYRKLSCTNESFYGKPKFIKRVKDENLTPESLAPQILHNIRYNQIPAGERHLTASILSRRFGRVRTLISNKQVELVNDALYILAEQGFLESLGNSNAGSPKYKINVPKVNAEVK